MCTQTQALEILGEVYRQCGSRFGCPIDDAYLYGSFARGDHHKDSDVDILLTVPSDDLAPLRKIAADVTSRLSLEHDVTVSVSIKPSDQFKRYGASVPYYQNVIREGIRYAH